MISIWIVKWSFLNQEPVKSQNVNIETEMANTFWDYSIQSRPDNVLSIKVLWINYMTSYLSLLMNN